MAANPTPALSFQNFYSAVLTAPMTNISLDAFLDVVPVGTEGFLVIDPDSATAREIIYYNTKTGTKVTVPSVADGRGQDGTTSVSHEAGTLVIMAPIAAFYTYLKTLFTTTPQGWTGIGGVLSMASGANKGAKEYVLDSTTDQTAVLSPGMRFKCTRGTTPPTTAWTIAAASSQYAAKATPTGLSAINNTVTYETWVNLSSYRNGMFFANRATDGSNGFFIDLIADGRVEFAWSNAGNYTNISTNQSIPLNQDTHLAVSVVASTGSAAFYINGTLVAATRTLFNATSIGASNYYLALGAQYLGGTASTFLDGKLFDTRIWSTSRTATQIRDNMNQQLVGNESGLSAYWKLTGDYLDSTSNANNLTASGGPGFTAAHAFKAIEYGIITKVTNSQITVFTGTDYNIPNMTLNTGSYSTQKTPFGFPGSTDKWSVTVPQNAQLYVSIPNSSNYFNTYHKITLPTGAWELSSVANVGTTSSTGGGHDQRVAVYPTTAASVGAGVIEPNGIPGLADRISQPNSGTFNERCSVLAAPVSNTTQTDYALLIFLSAPGTMTGGIRGVDPSALIAKCAYL